MPAPARCLVIQRGTHHEQEEEAEADDRCPSHPHHLCVYVCMSRWEELYQEPKGVDEGKENRDTKR